MTDKNISNISVERWQALYGSSPEGFKSHVQSTLTRTREGYPMKRFTARAVILVALCLVLLTGIALAAAGVFGTLDYLRVNTSAPADGEGVNIQTQIKQTGGDYPADGEEYGNGLFEMVDGQRNIIPGNVSGGGNGEFIWWPAVKEIPKSVTVRFRKSSTGEVLGTFDIFLWKRYQRRHQALRKS